MISAIKQLSNEVKHMPIPEDKAQAKPKQHDPIARTALERARRGHCMCGEGCDICKMAKFRAGRAHKNKAGIESAEHGYVLGIDYAGPFDKDNNGKIFFGNKNNNLNNE